MPEMRSDFETLAAEIGKLVNEKNAAYGDSFAKAGDFLALLFPERIERKQYAAMLGIVRIFDKMMRLAHKPDAFGEDPAKDIVGYGLLLAAMKLRADREKVLAAEKEYRASIDAQA